MVVTALRRDRKTPGVYVTEFPAFPPSVVGVATAVPCFIGYTEIATDPVKKTSLLNKPRAIASMAEYEACFGRHFQPTGQFQLSETQKGGDPTLFADFAEVVLINDPNPQDQSKWKPFLNVDVTSSRRCTLSTKEITEDSQLFNLYLSMQMFFANGGGYCFVVSVGNYKVSINVEDLSKGLQKAEDLPEVTMLVVPEACLLENQDYGRLAVEMLKQAKYKQNRVAILDLPSATTTCEIDYLKTQQVEFEKQISPAEECMSYGAAYAPAVESTYYSADHILKDAFSSANDYTLNKILTAQAIQLFSSDPSKLNDLINTLNWIATLFKVTPDNPPDDMKVTNLPDAKDLINTYRIFTKKLNDNDTEISLLSNLGSFVNQPQQDSHNALEHDSIFEKIMKYLAISMDTQKVDDNSQISAGKGCLVAIKPQEPDGVIATVTDDIADKNLRNALPLYKYIVGMAAQRLNYCPPSGIMAGIWTKNDAEYGVWNAPANVSLNMVERPLVLVNDQQQAEFNVPLSGKSISIHRALIGQGTVVWGARTLDGNSEDFRYIQVRRTLMYVEQSIKLAMQSVVFAVNDAKTWTTVVSLINNFLTNLWQANGLVGDKPEEAFSVACGIPTTMSGQDALNGYMIVNVKLTLIRPAEFIELTFTQQMQGVN